MQLAVGVADVREAIGWTQGEFAQLYCVSQAFVSQVERDQRAPSRRMLATLDDYAAATVLPTVEVVDGRGRPHTLPAHRWSPSTLSRAATMLLPTRLDWTRRQSHSWDLGDPDRRASLTSIVIAEGNAVDIAMLLDPAWVDEAVHLLPRDLRAAADAWR